MSEENKKSSRFGVPEDYRVKGKLGTEKPAAPQTAKKYLAEHTVAAGETLGDISLKYYNSAVKAKYMAIYEENKDIIGDNPNVIKPGMVLKIPEI